MSNRFIFLLEKYIGLFLCLFLDSWHKLKKVFTSQADIYHTGLGNLLFVKFVEQGALVLHYPAFAEAVKRYGKERVYICTFQSNKELLILLNVIEEKNILCLQEKGFFSFVSSFFVILRQCRKLRIGAVVDLEFFSRATAIFCYLSGAQIRAGYHRYHGLQNYRGNLFTHRLHYSHYEHLTRTGLALLESITHPPQRLPAIVISEEMTTQTAPTLPALPLPVLPGVAWQAQKTVIVTPNLCDPLPLRRWPAGNYAAWIKAMQAYDNELVFLLAGRKDEAAATDAFIQEHALQNVYNICGTTSLSGLVALYQRACLLLCSDSGPGHFAALTNTPCIVLFGPESPVLYGSMAQNIHVLYSRLPCSPCFNVYNNRSSPCTNNLCMQHISVLSVSEKAVRLLSAANRPA